MIAFNPQYVFLSTEPYPFQDKDIHELQVSLPNTKIVLVDGEMFSWYGSRLKKSFEYRNLETPKRSFLQLTPR